MWRRTCRCGRQNVKEHWSRFDIGTRNSSRNNCPAAQQPTNFRRPNGSVAHSQSVADLVPGRNRARKLRLMFPSGDCGGLHRTMEVPTRSSALLSKGGRARQSTNRGGSSSTEAAQTLVWKSSLATSCFCLVSGSAGTDPLCRSREGRPRHEGFCSPISCSAKPFKGPVVEVIPPSPPPCQYPLRRKSKRFGGFFQKPGAFSAHFPPFPTFLSVRRKDARGFSLPETGKRRGVRGFLLKKP